MKRLLCTIAASLATAVLQPAFAASEWFVAPDGNDTQPGTREKPFATPEAARDAIRKLKSAGPLPKGGVTVWLQGGNYSRDHSFELSSEDSGTVESPVVYRSVEGVAARFRGGRTVANFKPLTDPAILNRLDEAARARVVVSDLKALGITQLGELRARGFGRPTSAAHLELFFAGSPMTLARWPNEGEFVKISGIPQSHKDEHGGDLGNLTDGFNYSGDRPNRWKESDDIWVHGYWAWDWANSYERVATLDKSAHWIKTAPPHGQYGFRVGQRFSFINVLEELDQPGEYYVDKAAGLLYFWPPKPLESREAIVSITETPLAVLRDASNITLRGIVFEATRGMGVAITGGSNDCLAGCAVQLIGSTGISIDGGKNHLVTGCNVENTGDSGVTMSGGDRLTLTPGGHRVENSHFQKQGRWTKCYVPAILMSGVGLCASHNLIHDHPHCAILFNGNDMVIEFNEIHHIALETGDVGAIYTGRDYSFRGNVIRGNFIHDTGGVGMGSMGVYMDDCVSGTEIVSNVFYKVSRAAFLGGGRDHHVEYNTFIDCQPAVEIDGRGMDKSPVWHNMVYDYMKKQLKAVPQELYRSRYPAIATLDRYYEGDPGIPPEGNVVARNICVGKWLNIQWNADPKLQNVHDNYTGADPGFAAPEKLDFRLKPEAPLLKEGYKSIPMDQIGLHTDEFRREAAVR